MRWIALFAGTALLMASCTASPQRSLSELAIIPLPSEVEPSSSSAFTFDSGTEVALLGLDPLSTSAAARFVQAVRSESGIVLAEPRVAQAGDDDADSALAVRVSTDQGATAAAYTIDISEAGIDVRAGDSAGVQYGLETLRQLVAMTADGGHAVIPGGRIADQPRFSYRGMHLDVGRHFFGPDDIKAYLDLLARYKFNHFHWHLTEDQGWRIEIERYPRLTEIASRRAETILEKNFDPYVGDGIPHEGYYTQDEVRDIVGYAAERHITVIPEIEMPGHSQAALAAYPELACTEGPFEVSTTWGVHEEIYCPKEETFEFLQNVLSEVLELFPSEAIHIGGDEAPKKRWQESAQAQSVIRREGLSDERELQSYFIRRIESFLADRGRRLIGWDEILEGGLAPQATVMSWRGTEGGIEAAKLGHDVIMTPTSHCYFDYYQGPPESEPLAIGGDLPLDKVYSFEPVPPELSAEEARFILGAQGNVWTEYIKTWSHVEYMVLPRMLALAEVVWTPAELKDWSSFRQRALAHQELLMAAGHNVRSIEVADDGE